MIKMKIFIIVYCLLTVSFYSCKKYLDQKPLQSETVPSTPADLQAILDNVNFINLNATPDLGEVAADNYYITTATWQSLSSYYVNEYSNSLDDANNYVWKADATSINNWRTAYEGPIYYANNVIDLLPGISTDEQTRNQLLGSALFYRSFAFLQLAQIYCKPYSSTASNDLGIVLRLNSDINENSVRATVQQTYDQIIADLKRAGDLLPETVSFTTKPSKAATYGALARTYLSMRDYVNAGLYADSCLQKNSSLMDYNTLLPIGNPPIQWTNPEVIYFNTSYAMSILYNVYAKIDSILYQSYQSNDLRKTVFFITNTGADAGTYGFQGAYTGNFQGTAAYSRFNGIATDEMYLIRAESAARAGDVTAAMTDLNTLMIKRWKNNGSWVPFTAINAADALNQILTERRKELLYRELRWSDLRRLNLEGANITLTRIIGGVTYTLPPNDPRWVMLIPLDVINRSGIQQNPR